MPIEHINPASLPRKAAFTHVISVSSDMRTVYVGGQNALHATRGLIGPGDVRAQAEQAAHNLKLALEAGGATMADLVKCTVYLVAGQAPRAALEGWQRVWGGQSNPPCVTVLQVPGLANPDFLIEIDAIAAVAGART